MQLPLYKLVPSLHTHLPSTGIVFNSMHNSGFGTLEHFEPSN